MNPVTQVFFSLLTVLVFAGFGRALWRVIFDADEDERTLPPLPQGRLFDDGGLFGGYAPPAGLDEPLCSKVLDCGHACSCALGHEGRCACWRPQDGLVRHCGLDVDKKKRVP